MVFFYVSNQCYTAADTTSEKKNAHKKQDKLHAHEHNNNINGSVYKFAFTANRSFVRLILPKKWVFCEWCYFLRLQTVFICLCIVFIATTAAAAAATAAAAARDIISRSGCASGFVVCVRVCPMWGISAAFDAIFSISFVKF